jgi:aminoglycoside phosphotransferase family enzyme
MDSSHMGNHSSGGHEPKPGEGCVTLAAKVAFLGRPDAYPERPMLVEVIETHLSWVFLTDRYVYKLKKPALLPHLDFTTLKARETNSLMEVRLNRRLAPNVYLGVVGLMSLPDGALYLGQPHEGAAGKVVDWLVWMERLPVNRRLDEMIRGDAVIRADIVGLSIVLCRFYRQAPTIPMAPSDYNSRFEREVRINLDIIIPRVPSRLVDAARRAADGQVNFLAVHGDLLEERAAQGRIVEGHGDLRPEHVFLDGEPQVIDCLEFDRDLRLLDPVDELAYLGLECERLGALWICQEILDTYRARSGDVPDPRLHAFYGGFRASLRARLAALRLDDAPVERRADWLARIEAYLGLGIARGVQSASNSLMEPPP